MIGDPLKILSPEEKGKSALILSSGELALLVDHLLEDWMTVSMAKAGYSALMPDIRVIKFAKSREEYLREMVTHLQSNGKLKPWLYTLATHPRFKLISAYRWLGLMATEELPSEESVRLLAFETNGGGFHRRIKRPTKSQVYQLVTDALMKGNINLDDANSAFKAVGKNFNGSNGNSQYVLKETQRLDTHLVNLVQFLNSSNELGDWLYLIGHHERYKNQYGFALDWLTKLDPNNVDPNQEITEDDEDYIKVPMLSISETAYLAGQWLPYLSEEEADNALITMGFNPSWIPYSDYYYSYMYSILSHLNKSHRLGKWMDILAHDKIFNKTFAADWLKANRGKSKRKYVYKRKASVRTITESERAALAYDCYQYLKRDDSDAALRSVEMLSQLIIKQKDMADYMLVVIEQLESQSKLGDWLYHLATHPRFKYQFALGWLRQIGDTDAIALVADKPAVPDKFVTDAKQFVVDAEMFGKVQVNDIELRMMVDTFFMGHLTRAQANFALRMIGIHHRKVSTNEVLEEYFTEIIGHLYGRGKLMAWLYQLASFPMLKKQFAIFWLKEFAGFLAIVGKLPDIDDRQYRTLMSLAEVNGLYPYNQTVAPTDKQKGLIAEAIFNMKADKSHALGALGYLGVNKSGIANSKDEFLHYIKIIHHLNARGDMPKWVHVLAHHPRYSNAGAKYWLKTIWGVDSHGVEDITADQMSGIYPEFLADERVGQLNLTQPLPDVFFKHVQLHGLTVEQIESAMILLGLHKYDLVLGDSTSPKKWLEELQRNGRGSSGSQKVAQVMYVLAKHPRYKKDYMLYWLRELGCESTKAMLISERDVPRENVFLKERKYADSTLVPKVSVRKMQPKEMSRFYYIMSECLSSMDQAVTAVGMLGLDTSKLNRSSLAGLSLSLPRLLEDEGKVGEYLWLLANHDKFKSPMARELLEKVANDYGELIELPHDLPYIKLDLGEEDVRLEWLVHSMVTEYCRIDEAKKALSIMGFVDSEARLNRPLEKKLKTMVGLNTEYWFREYGSDAGYSKEEFEERVTYFWELALKLKSAAKLGTFLYVLSTHPSFGFTFARKRLDDFAVSPVDYDAVTYQEDILGGKQKEMLQALIEADEQQNPYESELSEMTEEFADHVDIADADNALTSSNLTFLKPEATEPVSYYRQLLTQLYLVAQLMTWLNGLKYSKKEIKGREIIDKWHKFFREQMDMDAYSPADDNDTDETQAKPLAFEKERAVLADELVEVLPIELGKRGLDDCKLPYPRDGSDVVKDFYSGILETLNIEQLLSWMQQLKSYELTRDATDCLDEWLPFFQQQLE